MSTPHRAPRQPLAWRVLTWPLVAMTWAMVAVVFWLDAVRGGGQTSWFVAFAAALASVASALSGRRRRI